MVTNRLIAGRISFDIVRQSLNLTLAIAQIGLTVVGYLINANSNFDSNTSEATTPVVPAGYVFAIWSLIYAGALVYAVYQALPSQRENELLRRIGFYTAGAYLATCLWLIAAQSGWFWLTVLFIFAIFGGILGAFIQFINYRAPRNNAERYFVVLPTSIYMGWLTVACVANTSTTLKNYNYNLGLTEALWAVIMLVVAGIIAGLVTLRSRGNTGYSLTIIWALVGVVVANLNRVSHPEVALTAGIVAAVVALAWGLARLKVLPAAWR